MPLYLHGQQRPHGIGNIPAPSYLLYPPGPPPTSAGHLGFQNDRKAGILDDPANFCHIRHYLRPGEIQTELGEQILTLIFEQFHGAFSFPPTLRATDMPDALKSAALPGAIHTRLRPF